MTHGRPCPIGPSKGKFLADCSGPPCVLFSRLGKREGLSNSLKGRCREAYLTYVRQLEPSWLIHENVVGFDEDILTRALPQYEIKAVTLDPRRFGMPVSRTRVYRLLFHRERLRWVPEVSLEELLCTPLPSTSVDMSPVSFYQLSDEDEIQALNLRRTGLSEWERDNLDSYRAVFPGKELYDVGQDSNTGHGRTELRDGVMMCLATTSRIWSEREERLLSGKESLSTLGLPVFPSMSRAGGVDIMEVGTLEDRNMRKCAGNGMSVPCVGFMLMVAMLCLEVK